ncbi:MAG: TonB C-terminal domain-containing protein [Deltaproteobacteria bacterium]|nr:TonB C-terminal domain-containing protein [Deltaproteobacteria bacterium]
MDVRDQYAYLKPQPIVWVSILGSALFHALLVGLLVAGGLLEEGREPLRQKALLTRLLKKGKKRPQNQLPHKDLRPAPAPAAPKPVPAEKAPPRSKPGPDKSSQPVRADYSSQMSSALASLQEHAEKDSKYEPDGDPDGVEEGDSLLKQKGDAYLTEVYKAIKAKYNVPELISDKERMFLRATVVITLTADGRIKDMSFEQRSGKDLFDSAIESAIRRAAPFPPPPPELAAKYSSVGIGLNFKASRM